MASLSLGIPFPSYTCRLARSSYRLSFCLPAGQQLVCTRPRAQLSQRSEERELKSKRKFESSPDVEFGKGMKQGASIFVGRAMAACVFLELIASLAVNGGAPAMAISLGELVFPWEGRGEQTVPPRGTCATCVGVVDDTLGTCDKIRNCVSSYDDRPAFFLAPWEYQGKLDVAMADLAKVVAMEGGVIQEQQDRYMYVTFEDDNGVFDDVEFLFSDPAEDRTVNIRAASRLLQRRDWGRNANRLEALRSDLQWTQVPILRNRERRFVVIESLWDTFGPEPPPIYDYENGLELSLSPNSD